MELKSTANHIHQRNVGLGDMVVKSPQQVRPRRTANLEQG